MKPLAGLLIVALLMVGCAGKKEGKPKAEAAPKSDSQPRTAQVVSKDPPAVPETPNQPVVPPIARDQQAGNLLKQLGISYQLYNDSFGKGPSKPEELAAFLENDQRILKPLKSGDLVLIYDVTLAKVPNHSATVLGYFKEVPTKGGWVLMADGRAVRMTAEEFKKAPQAKGK